VLARYDEQIREAGGRLYISGVHDAVRDQLIRTGKVQVHGPVEVFPATGVIGESSLHAYAEAQAWVVSVNGEAPERLRERQSE
jgi:SulP family sulfate permease